MCQLIAIAIPEMPFSIFMDNCLFLRGDFSDTNCGLDRTVVFMTQKLGKTVAFMQRNE